MKYNLAPELVPQLFVYESMLYRRLANGRLRELNTLNGGRLVAVVGGERIDAADIVWCLHYGNWPKYPLAILSGDPLDVHIGCLWPARVRMLRLRLSEENGQFGHPLSNRMFPTAEEATLDWRKLAAHYYRRDLDYVRAEEAQERNLRKSTLLVKPELAPKTNSRPARQARPVKPMVPADRDCHWYADQWVPVPLAAHVSDDWQVRCQQVLAGKTRFEFDPVTQTTVAVA